MESCARTHLFVAIQCWATATSSRAEETRSQCAAVLRRFLATTLAGAPAFTVTLPNIASQGEEVHLHVSEHGVVNALPFLKPGGVLFHRVAEILEKWRVNSRGAEVAEVDEGPALRRGPRLALSGQPGCCQVSELLAFLLLMDEKSVVYEGAMVLAARLATLVDLHAAATALPRERLRNVPALAPPRRPGRRGARVDPDQKLLVRQAVEDGDASNLSQMVRSLGSRAGGHRLEREELIRYLTRVRVDLEGAEDLHVHPE